MVERKYVDNDALELAKKFCADVQKSEQYVCNKLLFDNTFQRG